MIISAKFIGKDGSLGYTKGQIYILKVRSWKLGYIVLEKEQFPGEGICNYGSFRAFLMNWSEITALSTSMPT